MSEAQTWTLLDGLLVITVTMPILLVRTVRVEVRKVCAQIDRITERMQNSS